jgi:hypothetical protein
MSGSSVVTPTRVPTTWPTSWRWYRRALIFLVANGRIGADLSAALKAEATRRADSGTFFGHIAYASLMARKPLLA